MATAPAERGSAPWRRYIAAVARYKWLILGLLVLGTAAGIFATRFIEPVYQAKAVVWLQTGGRVTGTGPVDADPQDVKFNWQQTLMSRSVITGIAQRRQLFLTPANLADSTVFSGFYGTDSLRRGSYELRVDSTGAKYSLVRVVSERKSTFAPVETGAVGDSIGRAIGFGWQPSSAALGRNRTIAFKAVTPGSAASALIGNMLVEMPARTSTMVLTLSGPDPQRTAAALNALVTDFEDVAVEIRSRNASTIAQSLKRQADSADAQLRKSETALERFRINTITLPSDAITIQPGLQSTSPPALAEFYSQNQQVDKLRRDRLELERLLRDARAGAISIPSFMGVAAVNNSPDLQQALKDLSAKESALRTARATFTDSARGVQIPLAEARALRTQLIPQLTQELIADLRSRETTLDSQIQKATRELKGIPSRMIEEQRLRRDVVSKEGIFQNTLGKYEDMRLQQLSTGRPIQVLDRAVVPVRPVSEDRSAQIILAALLASLGLGIGGAILLDMTDKRFRYPEQATGELGLPIVGAVPRFEISKNGERDPEETAQVVEAFRTIRMNLRSAYDGNGPVVLTVSSPGVGDGKSMVSANLALSFAESGARVLLVDGDTRRGELHEMFDVTRRPGLLDYLGGGVPIESVLRETSHENLTLIPGGTRRHRGPELLQSHVLEQFIDDMRSRYEVVIVDSPPLGAGIDPFVLGQATGNLVLVLRTGETDRKQAEARMEALHRLPIRLLGAVLNDVRAEGAFRYYSYIYGYSMEDDEGMPQLASRSGSGN
ncbi:MAG: polysaccharide biosynthesis tyrosine autokinase [Gemmatimonadaceae bacterium]